MEMLEHMNLAMRYIEAHLDENIEVLALAKIVGCSAHHFSRMFSFIAGLSLSEYIRRRRLSAAGIDLQTSDAKVIDVALRYGYDSPTAFNRAFQNLHGITPTEARKGEAKLKAYPVMSFHLSIKGDVQMNYRIIEKEKLTIAGYKKTMNLVNGDEDFSGINAMWADLTGEQASKLLHVSNGEIDGLIGVSASNNGKTFDYYIACTADKNDCQSFDVQDIPATAWGVFESVGPLPDAIVDTWKRIFSEWFPSSGYESAPLPTIEIYSDGDSSAEDYTCELWVPIAKLK